MEARPVQKITPDSAQLVKKQTEGSEAVQTAQEVPREQIEAGGPELKKLNQRLTSIRLNKEGVIPNE